MSGNKLYVQVRAYHSDKKYLSYVSSIRLKLYVLDVYLHVALALCNE